MTKSEEYPGHLMIFTTMVDADAPLIPGDTPKNLAGPQYLASLGRELAANDPQEVALGVDRRRGRHPNVRNAQLVMPAPFPVRGGGKPVAAFSQTFDEEARIVRFAASSYDYDGSIVKAEWDFGDGTTATGLYPTKFYERYGKYPVTLRVTDNLGYQGETTKEIRLQNPCRCEELSDDTLSVVSRTIQRVKGLTRITPALRTLYVPAGTSALTFTTGNSRNGIDVDFYVRSGTMPTQSAHACAATAAGSDEACTIQNPAAGYWYIEAVPKGVPPLGHVTFDGIELEEVPFEYLQPLTFDLTARVH
jgi:hypothetical protein